METIQDGTPNELRDRLARAADQVVQVPLPEEAVLRGGRRRRAARRLAVCVAGLATAGVVLTGVTLLPDRDGRADGPATAAPSAPPPATPDPTSPERTVIGTGEVDGVAFEASVDVWAVPGSEAEAWRQIDAMLDRYDSVAALPEGVDDGADAGGELPSGYLDAPHFVVQATLAGDRVWLAGGSLADFADQISTVSGGEGAPAAPPEFTVGWAPDRVSSIEVRWDDGSRVTPELVAAAGADGRWFPVLRPEGSTAEEYTLMFTEDDPSLAPSDTTRGP